MVQGHWVVRLIFGVLFGGTDFTNIKITAIAQRA